MIYLTDQYMEYMPKRIANSFYLEPIASDDILLEIKRRKQNKSPGHDLIGSKVKRLCPEIFLQICQKYIIGGLKTANALIYLK